MGWWTDLWGDSYTEKVLEQNPGMSFLDAKREGDRWEQSGQRNYQDYRQSRSRGRDRGRDRGYDSYDRGYQQDSYRESRRDDRRRDSYQDYGRQEQRQPSSYDYKSPEGTRLKGMTWPGGNRNLTKFGFSKNQSEAIMKYNPNISEQQASDLARAVQDIVNSGNVKEDSPWWNLWRGDDRHKQDAAIKSIMESGQDFKDVAKAYRDAGRPITYNEAINASDPESTSSLESESKRLGLERSTELYEQAKQDKEKLDQRSDELYRSSQEERERRIRLEDEALRQSRESRKLTTEERLNAIENYRGARDQYEQDRMSRTSLMNEIRNAPSTFEEAQRQGHEQSLKNTAALTSVLPTRAGGSAVKELLDRQQELDLNVASSSSVGRLQEIENRRNLLGNLLGQQQSGAQRQQQIDQQAGLSATQQGALDLQFSQMPLNISKGSGDASRFDLQSSIQNRQQGLNAVQLSGNFGSQSLGTNLNYNKFYGDEQQREFQRSMDQWKMGLDTAKLGLNAASGGTGALSKLWGGS